MNIQAKSEEQKKLLTAWAQNGFRGSGFAATGFGKTKPGIEAACWPIRQDPTHRSIILVPRIPLIGQFADEAAKWGYAQEWNSVECVCIQTAYKYKGQHYETVVVDEVHLCISPKYRQFFENNTFDRILCLTATPPEEPEYRKYLKELAPEVYRITLDECVNKGLISPFNIYLVPVELTQKEQKLYNKYDTAFHYYKNQLGGYGAFDHAQEILKDPNAGKIEKKNAVMFFRTIRLRKEVVQKAKAKLEAAERIIMDTDDVTLTFGGLNDYTDALAERLGDIALAYHSGKTARQRKQTLGAFKSQLTDIRVLCSTKALDQGLDVPDATLGIIYGTTSKSLTMIQRVGRLVRYKHGKIGNVVVLYVKNSVEETWVTKALLKLTAQTCTIDELPFTNSYQASCQATIDVSDGLESA